MMCDGIRQTPSSNISGDIDADVAERVAERG